MKNAFVIAALVLLASACSTEGSFPIEFKVPMCQNTLNKGMTASSTATTEKEICGEEVLVIRGQFNPTKSLHCDSGCAKDEYGDMALWNQFGQTVRFYCWVNAITPAASCFNRDYISVQTMGMYDSTEGYHPEGDGIGMTTVHEDDTIYVKVCTQIGQYLTDEGPCSEIQSFKMVDGHYRSS